MLLIKCKFPMSSKTGLLITCTQVCSYAGYRKQNFLTTIVELKTV